MDIQKIKTMIDVIVIAISIVAAIFTAGIIWRVDKKIGIAYKFFLCAIIVFLLEEIVIFLGFAKEVSAVGVAYISKLLLAVFFLGGIITMRDLIRRINGEKKSWDFYAKIPAKNKENK